MAKFYTRQDLRLLFLVCAFPLHVWTIVFGLLDIPWLTERTNLWDALGVIAYGLIFAFLESLTIWLAASLLGLLISPLWGSKRRTAVMAALVLTLSLWAMAGSLYLLQDVTLPSWLLKPLALSGHPLKLLYAALLCLTTPSFALPAYFILRSARFYQFTRNLLERLALLTAVYLVLDGISLIVVFLRNL